MAKDLDEQVKAFRTRPLDAGPYTFVADDALVLKVRENGRVVGVHTLIATWVNVEGYREILGVSISSTEDGAGWLASFRDLVAQGLSGVALVISDAHPGLVAAIGATLPGTANESTRTSMASQDAAALLALHRARRGYALKTRLNRMLVPALLGLMYSRIESKRPSRIWKTQQ